MNKLLLSVLLLVAFAAVAVSAAESPKLLSGADLWEKYRTVLFDFLRQGDKNAMPGLQLVTAPVPAEWDENKEALDLIAGSVPKWGISWEMSTKTFHKEYYNFITNLQMPPSTNDPALMKKIQDAEDKYFDLQMDQEDHEMKVMERYERSVYKKRMSYEQYKARDPRTSRLADQILMMRADIELLKIPGWGKWFTARTALGKYLTTPEAERNFVALGSVKRFADEAAQDKTNSFEVKVTSKTVTSTRKTYEMGIGVGVNLAFANGVSVGVDGAYNKQGMNFKTSTDDLQIIIGAKGWKAIPVQPKRTWYEPELFEKYRNEQTRKQVNFFGVKGNSQSIATARVPHYPKMLYTIVGPQVTMFVSKEDAEEIQKSTDFSLKANVGFSLGNVNFDFSKKDTKEFKQENSKLYKVTMTGNSPTPVLFAVDNHVLAI